MNTPEQLAQLTKLKRIKQTELDEVHDLWCQACLAVYEGYRLSALEVGTIAGVSRARIQQVLAEQQLKRTAEQRAAEAAEIEDEANANL